MSDNKQTLESQPAMPYAAFLQPITEGKCVDCGKPTEVISNQASHWLLRAGQVPLHPLSGLPAGSMAPNAR